MPGVVVYLTFTLMYGAIITHSFITCKLHLSSLAKAPTSIVNYPCKALRGVDNKILTIYICQDKVSADQYHLNVLWAQVSAHRGRVLF